MPDRLHLAELRRFGNLLFDTDGANSPGAKIPRRLLPKWVLLQGTGLGLHFTHRRSAAKSSILDPSDHVDSIKVGLQILNLTVMFDLNLLNQIVELTLGSVDLCRD